MFNPWPAVYICGDARSRSPMLKCNVDEETHRDVLEGVREAVQTQVLQQEGDEHKVENVVFLTAEEIQSVIKDVGQYSIVCLYKRRLTLIW